MNLHIVRFADIYADAVSALILCNLREVNIRDYTAEEMDRFSKEFSPAHLRQLARKRIIYVALLDGVPIATGGIGRDLAHGWMLLALFVRPDLHRKGVGQQLLERLENCAREINASHLTLHASLTANRFYEKQGYHYIDGERVRDPAGYYRMIKDMTKSRRPSLMAQLALDPACDNRISIVGSGGKTTLLYLLAHHFAKEQLSVAVTTTTHILRPLDCPVCESDIPVLTRGSFIVCGSPAAPDANSGAAKLGPPAPALLEALLRDADLLLIEADGSRGMPVKLPNVSEPVLLRQTNRIIAVAGLSALDKPLSQVCHRAELAQEVLGVSADTIVTEELLATLLLRGYGELNRLTVLLNQADTPLLETRGDRIAALLRADGIFRTCVGSLKREVKTL